MKTISNILITVLSIFTLSTTVIYGDGFNAIYSPNGSFLWTVGSGGNIYRSFDAGQTFESHSMGSANYNSITGKIITIWIAGDNGTLLISTNNGGSFTQYNVGSGENLRSVFFTDVNTGWLACSSGKIYKSINGGLNWTAQTTPVTYDLNSIKFINASTGAACGKQGTILLTTNGGSTWNLSAAGTNKELLTIDISGNTIMATGVDAAVVSSSNLGNTWSVIDFNITTKPDIGGLYIVNSNTYFTTGIGGFIRKTTNSGASFTYPESPIMMDLNGMYFFDSTRGWAFSNTSNIILRTINAGANWLAPTGTVQTLSWDLKFTYNPFTTTGNVFYQSTWNKKEIFANKTQYVFRSLNAGDTWTQVGNATNYGAGANAFLISESDSNTFLIAMDSSFVYGKVLRSTNYGQTWSETYSGKRSEDGIPFARDPNNPNVIYYAPEDTMLLRSTNFGLNWVPVGTQKFGDVCAMLVPKTNSNIIIVGTNSDYGHVPVSKVRRTTDAGLTWTIVDSNAIGKGFFPEVPAIVGSNLNPIIYCAQFQGDFGGVKRSFDNGATWSYVNLDAGVWGMDISKDDPNALAYALTVSQPQEAGYISFNRGVHFDDLPLTSGTGNNAVYYYNRNTLLFQQENGIYKLHVTLSNPIGIQPISTEIPKQFSLSQNYPNPFNPSTKIKFLIPGSSVAQTFLSVYNALGQEITTLVKEQLKPGVYEVDWNAANYPSGVYFYKLVIGENTSNGFNDTKKMVLVK